MERKIVIPGELVIVGDDYLPGTSTEKKDGGIYSLRFGMATEKDNLVRIIPLSGAYDPKRGNIIIGKVENMVGNGWIIDMGAADNGFLNIMEIPRFVNKDAMDEILTIGDMVIAKIYAITGRGIDLSLKSRGLGKVEEGNIFYVNANKVPRIIGKEGSMIKLIKENTGCDITVGQNGAILLNAEEISAELYAKRAILFVEQNTHVEGLTSKVTDWFTENKK